MGDTPPVVLTIAGSDSSGGAGIHADLRTFAALGIHGATAITAITAQNTVEVRDVLATPADFLQAQIEAVLDDLTVAAVKTGMLATAENVRVVAEFAAAGRLPNLVIDPVLVASTGRRLLDDDAEQAYVTSLFPYALVITPNWKEAGVLLGRDTSGVGAQLDAARDLHKTGARYVVVTGGDGVDAEAIDIVFDGALTAELAAPRISTTNSHGTGCSFASAIASNLALGHDPILAIEKAKQFVHTAIAGATRQRLGAGRGPIDQLSFTTKGTSP